MKQIKQNPFLRWSLDCKDWERKRKVLAVKDNLEDNWDYMNCDRYSRDCPGLVSTRHGERGRVDTYDLFTDCSYATGIGCENWSRVIAPIDFKVLEETVKSKVNDPELRAHLNCLPAIRNDPVAQKLEWFFNDVKAPYRIDYAMDLPMHVICREPSYDDKLILRGIAGAYTRLATRTMKQEEYEFLSNANFEGFSDECLKEIREERKQKSEEEKRKTTFLAGGLRAVDNGRSVTYHDGKGGHWCFVKQTEDGKTKDNFIS